MVFFKKILQQTPQIDNNLMRHLLIGLLVSYRQYRKFVGFHGQVSQTTVVGVENPQGSLYPNNERADFYDSTGKLKNKLDGKISGQEHLDIDLYDFRYRLIYQHLHMTTIKQWLDKRINALDKKAK